ncbi:hypothetical protein [Candidatus Magnetominusculus dajiuhuensis]|uniref:hypothetical protein n=1 Tax=Candidatus Magnetominusculus dajiuhuensis TaxID=3137712 RepID=UPI003B4348BA
MDKGTVLSHRDFAFKDGEYGDKLIIILNKPRPDEPYLCCKTTSKTKYKIETEGCHSSQNIFVLGKIKNCFTKKTYVQFHEFYDFDSQKLLKGHFEGKIDIIFTLPENIINAIVNCIKKSDDITDDQLNLLN